MSKMLTYLTVCQILDGWRVDNRDSCFKLSRLPEQPALVPKQVSSLTHQAVVAAHCCCTPCLAGNGISCKCVSGDADAFGTMTTPH